MSYTPTEWATGDVITAEKLNNMESGIAANNLIMFVDVDQETGAMNKTWNEIKSALSSGHILLYPYSDEIEVQFNIISYVTPHADGYGVYINFQDNPAFSADSADEYPVSIDG